MAPPTAIALTPAILTLYPPPPPLQRRRTWVDLGQVDGRAVGHHIVAHPHLCTGAGQQGEMGPGRAEHAVVEGCNRATKQLLRVERRHGAGHVTRLSNACGAWKARLQPDAEPAHHRTRRPPCQQCPTCLHSGVVRGWRTLDEGQGGCVCCRAASKATERTHHNNTPLSHPCLPRPARK